MSNTDSIQGNPDDPARLKCAGQQVADLIGDQAHRMPKGARRNMAYALMDALYYDLKYGEDLESAVQGKAEIYLAKLEANVPLEKQKRTGSIVEIVEGVDNEKEIDEDMIGEKVDGRRLAGLQRSNTRLLAELSKSDTKIADLTAELARANKALLNQPQPAPVPAPSGTSGLIDLVRKLEGDKTDIELRLERALWRIRELETQGTDAPPPLPLKHPTEDGIPAHETFLDAWAQGRFEIIVEKTGVTLDAFVRMVSTGTIDAWADAMIADGKIQESQRRSVTGVARKVRVSLGLAEAPKAQSKSPAPVPAIAAELHPIFGNHRLSREQILTNRYLCGACSLLEKTVKVSLDEFIAIVCDGRFDAWLEVVSENLDRFQPRMLTGLMRRVQEVLEEHSNGSLPQIPAVRAASQYAP